MKKATVHMAYGNNDEKVEEFSSYAEAKRKATDENWWPNDFNSSSDMAIILVTDSTNGKLLRKIVINQ